MLKNNTMPAKTANGEDRLPLDRALRALEEAKKSLKELAEKPSVIQNLELSQAVARARRAVDGMPSRSIPIIL